MLFLVRLWSDSSRKDGLGLGRSAADTVNSLPEQHVKSEEILLIF